MKKFFIAALAVLAIVGCKNQKQSELDFNAKAGVATVSGTVMYDYGYEMVNGSLVKAKKALGEGVMVAYISYDEYDAAAVGIKQIEAEIKDGKFSVEIPVSMEAITVNFEVRGFYAKHYGSLDNAGKPIEQNAFYESPFIAPLTVVANYVADLGEIVMAPNLEELSTRTQKVTLKGTVYGQYEKKKMVDDEDDTKGFYGMFESQKLGNVALVVTLSNADPDDDREIVYNVTTDEKGAYELECDFYTAWGTLADVNVKVEAKAFVYDLTHYYAYYDKEAAECVYTSQKVAGYYNDANNTGALDGGAILLGKTMDVTMPFVALSTEKVYGLGNAIDTADDNKDFNHTKITTPGVFNQNPMGW